MFTGVKWCPNGPLKVSNPLVIASKDIFGVDVFNDLVIHFSATRFYRECRSRIYLDYQSDPYGKKQNEKSWWEHMGHNNKDKTLDF